MGLLKRMVRDSGIASSMRRGDIGLDRAKKDFNSRNGDRIKKAIDEAIAGDRMELDAIYREVRLILETTGFFLDSIHKHPEVARFLKTNTAAKEEARKLAKSLEEISRAIHENANVIFKSAEELRKAA